MLLGFMVHNIPMHRAWPGKLPTTKRDVLEIILLVLTRGQQSHAVQKYILLN